MPLSQRGDPTPLKGGLEDRPSPVLSTPNTSPVLLFSSWLHTHP